MAALATLGSQKVKFTVRAAALGAGLEVDVLGVSQVSQLTDRLGDAPVVVSALPANVLTCRISSRNRAYGHLPLDVVYAGWPVRTFEEAVARVVSGFEVLLHRAAGQVHLMTGLLGAVEQLRAAGRAAVESR